MKGKWPNHLNSEMKKAGLGPTELARKARTTKQEVSRLAKGERKLTKEWAEKLAGPLKIEPSVLLWAESEPAPAAPPKEPKKEKSEAGGLDRLLKGAPRETKIKARQIIEILLKTG
jgi:ribosome-binding protein aMBF1 (putative translation factor)